MSKNELISIRISSQQKETCKKLNLSYSQIWSFGFENLVPKMKEELKILAQKHHNLYIQYNQMYIQFNDENEENLSKLDEFCKEFINSRPIENPDQQDRFWIKCKIKDHKLGINVESFLDRCKELKRGSQK